MHRFEVVSKLFELFTPKERKKAWVILGLSVLTGFAQSVGVISVLPFLNVVLDPEVIFRTPILTFLYEFFGFTRALHFLMLLGAFVFVALASSNIISAFTLWMRTRFVNQQNHTMSVKLLSRYLTQPYEFFLTRNTNELSKNILAEVNTLTGGLVMAIMEIVTYTLVLIFIMMTILIIDFRATIIAALIFGVLYGTVMLFLRQKLKRRGTLVREENAKRYRFTNEALSSFKTTKVIHAERFYVESYKSSSQAFARHNTFAQVVGVLPKFLIEIVAVGGLVIFVLAQLALGRELESLAPVVGVLGLAGYRMLPAVQIVFQQLTAIQYTRPVLDRLYEDLMDVKGQPLHGIEKNIDKRSISPLKFHEAITLKEVTFNYNNTDFAVLNGIDLTIHKNEVIGLVGETGSGKTTLVDVLMGLLHVSSGSMLIDSQPLDESNIHAWQKNIGYVPQEIYLSDASLKKNIAFGVDEHEIDFERVRDAARVASLDTFIEELPEQYETVVGERGVRLSGGQRQRIGIARAVYRNPDVLVLDEATSALDGTTEENVLKAMYSAAKERTVIMVAHRLNTLMDCDVIYMIEKGVIVAKGTYQELLSNNETFKRMAKEPKDSKLG